MKTVLMALFFCSLNIFSFGEETTASPPTSTNVPAVIESHASPVEHSSAYENTLIKMVITLSGLVILVFVTIWVLKKISHGRLGGFSSQKKINILEKKPLSPKTLLYLIEVEGKKILLTESQLEITAHKLAEDHDPYD